MRRKVCALAEASEVNDAAHAGVSRGFGEVGGRFAVVVLKAAGGSHRMHEIVRGLDATERVPQRRSVEKVSPYRFAGALQPALEVIGVAGQAAYSLAVRLQLRKQPAANVACGTCEKDRRVS